MEFRGEYAFLSNFYDAPIRYKGKVYPTAEHLFQACKALLDDEREFIRKAETPALAKRRGAIVALRPSWGEIRVSAMRGCLRLKFTQHPELLRRLKAIEGEIVEDNTWRDTFWGKCNGQGENMLGQLLMEIRDTL